MPDDTTQTVQEASPAKTESTAEGAPSPDGKASEGQEPPKKISIFKGLGPQMLLALKENDLHRTQGMILGGVELDCRDYRGRTPLHIACEREALGVVRLLLERKADPNVLDAVHEISPMHIAAYKNQGIMVKHLVRHGANCNIVGVDGDTPLSRAAGRGHEKVIKILLQNKDVVIDLDVRDPATNEYISRENAAIEALGSAADSSANDDDGSPTDGGRRGRSRVRKELNSANDSARSASTKRSGASRGRSGSRNRQPRVQQRDRRPPMSPLLKAVKRNAKIEIVEALLTAGCNVERADEKLNRSIHCAAHYGNANTVRFLLNAKSDPAAPNLNGRTPLHFAARSGHPRIVKMLLSEKGVELNYPDQFGQTPLSVSADTQIRKMLTDAGGIINADEVKRNVSAPVSPERSPSPSPIDRSVSPSPADRKPIGHPSQHDAFAPQPGLGDKVVLING